VIEIKILGMRKSERYALRRLVLAAQRELGSNHPDLHIKISEISEPAQINSYVHYLVQPSLVVNEKVVCSGYIPAEEEIINWLYEAGKNARNCTPDE
jgi:hypothetical protein